MLGSTILAGSPLYIKSYFSGISDIPPSPTFQLRDTSKELLVDEQNALSC